MTERADRRSFFLHLVREAAEVAREVREAIRSEIEPELVTEGLWETGGEDPWYTEPPEPAPPAARTADLDELQALCREARLGRRWPSIRELARTSIRLTRADEGGRSRLGGAPSLPGAMEWPSFQGRPLAFLGQVDLAQVAALDPASPLPRHGLLLFFYDLEGSPSGLEPAHRGSCRVVHVPAEADGSPASPAGPLLPECPLRLSAELCLPRSWSLPAEALDLDSEEALAWDSLREKLALAQGVELEELAPRWLSLHRLLGYPDELGGDMEVHCHQAWIGMGPDEEARDLPGEGEEDPLRAAALQWKLLLQLSDDERLGSPFGQGFGRLFFWVREEDLRRQRFDGAWAILQ